MRPAHAYFGIGIVMILSLIAFINPAFIHHMDDGEVAPSGDAAAPIIMSFTLSSPAFAEDSLIPSQYTCDASQASPPLSISGAPRGTKSFALVMEDLDAVPVQKSGIFVNWILFNIPASITAIVEDAKIGTPGENGAGKNSYAGPCPSPQHEPAEHRYRFTLYAVDKLLKLEVGANQEQLLKAMRGHILAETTLIGRYKRN